MGIFLDSQAYLYEQTYKKKINFFISIFIFLQRLHYVLLNYTWYKLFNHVALFK